MSDNVVIDLTGDEENDKSQESLNEFVTSPSKDIKSYFATKSNSKQDTPCSRKRLELDEDSNESKNVNIIAARRKPTGNTQQETFLQTKPPLTMNKSTALEEYSKEQSQSTIIAPEAVAGLSIRDRIQETLSRIKTVAFGLANEDDDEKQLPSNMKAKSLTKEDDDKSSNKDDKTKFEQGHNSMDLLDQYFPSSGDLKAAREMLGITDEDDTSIQMIEKESINLCKNLLIPSLPLTEESEKLDLDIEQRLRSIAKVVDSSKALRALGIDQVVEQNKHDPDEADVDDEEEVPDYENDDECYVCGEGGLLYLCDRCPKSFHADCMDDEPPSKDDGDDSESEEFICPVCLGEDFIDDSSDEEINVLKATELVLPFRQAREARVNELKAAKKNPAALHAEEALTAVKDRHTQALRSLIWNTDEAYEAITREMERAGKFAESQHLLGREALVIENMAKKQRELEEAKKLDLSFRRKSSLQPTNDDEQTKQTNSKSNITKQKKTKRRDSLSSHSSSSHTWDDNEYRLHFDPGEDVVCD